MSDPRVLLERRVNNMLVAAVVVGDTVTGGCHRAQVAARASEGKDGIRILTSFGFAMRLEPGATAETVLLAVERDLRYALPPHDPRYQPGDLKPGESAVYNADDIDGGCRIHLKRGRVIEIICKDAVVRAENSARVEADHVQAHARVSHSWDVHGFGESWTWLGGTNWEHKTWQQGATVSTVVLPIKPPEGP